MSDPDAVMADVTRVLTKLDPKDTEEAIAQLFLMYSRLNVALKEERAQRAALERVFFAFCRDYCIRFAGMPSEITVNLEMMEKLLKGGAS